MSIKNPTLRRRTKELTECANDARECQLLGYELKELGSLVTSLVTSMAIHMGDLQIKALNEKLTNSEIPNNCEVKNYCDDCLYTDTCDSKEFFYACTSKATISKMEQVEDEPQTELVRVKYHCINCAENGSYKCSKCDGEMYYKYDKDEPQTDCAWR